MNLKVSAFLRKQSHFRFSRNELDRTHVTKHYHTRKVHVTQENISWESIQAPVAAVSNM